MPHLNPGRVIAAVLGFVLLSGCLGAPDQAESNDEGRPQTKAQPRGDQDEFEFTEDEIQKLLDEKESGDEDDRQIDEDNRRIEEDEKAVESPDMVLAERARLISVTDGDTVKVGLANGSRANVRIIGIDTPETYPTVECGGREATTNMRRLVGPGDTVDLFLDPTQDEVDRYGRLLRYVFTAGDVDVGMQQIGTGHASVYVYNNNPFVTLDAYQAAEDDARTNNDGLWGAC